MRVWRPTTLDEARVHVDIGRPRWVPVLAHMVALDAVNPQPPPARGVCRSMRRFGDAQQSRRDAIVV